MAEREGEPVAMYGIRETEGKGCGLFAARDIEQGEHILRIDMRPLKKFTVQELAEHEELDGSHADYVGHGKYVMDDSPGSYMNHSCDPTCYYKMRSIAVKDVYAARHIREGEELTHDYTATSVDQFAGHGIWVLECQCGSMTCRGQVTGDFFELPIDLQRQSIPISPLQSGGSTAIASSSWHAMVPQRDNSTVAAVHAPSAHSAGIVREIMGPRTGVLCGEMS